MYPLILVILLLFILWKLFCCVNKIDYFDNLYNNFQKIEKQSIINKQNQQLYNDAAFDDVKYYQNDKTGLGIDRCMENKYGHCMEFGITGNAYYYPPSKSNLYLGEITNMDEFQKHLDREKDVTAKNTSEYLHYPIF
jgi:hypothetical protein